MKTVAIIGAGWYGFHLAVTLSEKGFRVVLCEKNDKIFNELSGNFGVRLHLGLHYPRSKKTREGCIAGYDEFLHTYPELVNHHEHSIYGIGVLDADQQPSKISAEDFNRLKDEHDSFKVIDPKEWGYQNLQTAIDTTEASLVVGRKLRTKIEQYLAESRVELKLSTEVVSVFQDQNKKMVVSTRNGQKESKESFDYVINATSYQCFLSKNKELPFDMEVGYQVCIALFYEDTQEKRMPKPIPFIVMDGWFPCLMLYNDGEEKENSTYLLYHGKYSILDTCATAGEAKELLQKRLQDKQMESHIERLARTHFASFYPEFSSERFKYLGWKGNVLAKAKTNKEFRGAFVLEDADTKIIHIFPGKVNNIFDVGREVLDLIEADLHPEEIITENGYRCTRKGALFQARCEISEKPDELLRNTSSLQTAEAVKRSLDGPLSFFGNAKSPRRIAEEKIVSVSKSPMRIIEDQVHLRSATPIYSVS